MFCWFFFFVLCLCFVSSSVLVFALILYTSGCGFNESVSDWHAEEVNDEFCDFLCAQQKAHSAAHHSFAFYCCAATLLSFFVALGGQQAQRRNANVCASHPARAPCRHRPRCVLHNMREKKRMFQKNEGGIVAQRD